MNFDSGASKLLKLYYLVFQIYLMKTKLFNFDIFQFWCSLWGKLHKVLYLRALMSGYNGSKKQVLAVHKFSLCLRNCHLVMKFWTKIFAYLYESIIQLPKLENKIFYKLLQFYIGCFWVEIGISLALNHHLKSLNDWWFCCYKTPVISLNQFLWVEQVGQVVVALEKEVGTQWLSPAK